MSAVQLELTDPAWRAYVDRHPAALPFHLPDWAGVVADVYRLPAFVVAVHDDAGAIVAGIPVITTSVPFRPKRLVSLPFTDICPPLAESPADASRLVAALESARLAAGAGRVEVRGAITGGAPLEDAGYRHVLALETDADAVYARFHRSQVQRNIRRAEASDLSLTVGTADRDRLDDFYALHLATRRRLGVPIQPRRFFAAIRERILRPGIGWVVVVSSDDRPIAAAMFMAHNGTVVYKYGASDADAWSLRPNHLLFWNAIRDACATGQRSFDFGRTDADADGLRAFKRSWGADEERLVYHAVGDVPALEKSPAGPGPARRLMQEVIRRSPAWVCRVSGELLYRFAA